MHAGGRHTDRTRVDASRCLRAALLLAAFVVTSWSLLGAPASAQGQARLSLSSVGLPQNLKASIVLDGKGADLDVRFSGTRVLTLAPGSYSVFVKTVAAGRPGRGVERGAIAYPEKKRIRVTVKSGAVSKLEIRYRAVVNPGVKPLPPRVLRVIGDPEDPSAILLAAPAKPPPIGTIYTTAPSSLLPRGLISKVTRTKKTGPRIRVSLRAVPVTDAVPSLEFNGNLALEPLTASSADSVAASSAGREQAAASKSSCSPPKLLKIRAHLDSLELRQASIGAWPPQMRLTLAIRTTESLGVAAAAVGINCDWTLAELGPFQAAIPVGPVVIPVYATVPVAASVHINGRFDVGTVNIASTTVATVAAGFDENKASLSQQGTNVWTSGTLALSGSARLGASIGVEAGIGVAKGANVHVSARFGPEFSWSSGRSCDLFLNLGTLSAGVTVLGKNLNTPGFTPLKPKLWSGCGRGSSPDSGGGSGSGGGGGGGSGGGGGGGGTPSTIYHTSAEGPYTGSPPEQHKPESPRLSLGYNYGCAIAISKAVRCFGGNLDFYDAASVAGEFQQLSVGSVVSCGVKTDSTLACWGWLHPDPSGLLGLPPAGSFRSVSVGLSHACAVDTRYILTCWGQDADTPAAVPHPGRYSEVSAGWEYTCGIHTDGRLDCWGLGPFGDSEIPPPSGTFREVSVGEGVACGLTYLNNVTCWESDGTRTRTHSGPFTDVDVTDGWACAREVGGAPTCFAPISSFSPNHAFAPRAGNYSDLSLSNVGACGRRGDGSVTCWGGAYAGQVTPAPGPFTSLMAGSAFTCGLRPDQSAACWGNTDGEAPTQLEGSFLQVSGGGRIGHGNLCGIQTDHALTCLGGVNPLAGPYQDIAVTEYDGCAIASGSGSVSCWALGTPAPTPPSGPFIQISGNGFGPWSRYCALRPDHTVACWQPDDTIPLTAPPADHFTKVAVGAYWTDCGIRTDGTLSCWKPAPYAGPGSPPAGTFVDVAVGGQAACAIRTNGSIACWGRGDYGETSHPAGSFTQIVAGDSHMCALRSDNSAACWGHGEALSAG